MVWPTDGAGWQLYFCGKAGWTVDTIGPLLGPTAATATLHHLLWNLALQANWNPLFVPTAQRPTVTNRRKKTTGRNTHSLTVTFLWQSQGCVSHCWKSETEIFQGADWVRRCPGKHNEIKAASVAISINNTCHVFLWQTTWLCLINWLSHAVYIDACVYFCDFMCRWLRHYPVMLLSQSATDTSFPAVNLSSCVFPADGIVAVVTAAFFGTPPQVWNGSDKKINKIKDSRK